MIWAACGPVRQIAHGLRTAKQKQKNPQMGVLLHSICGQIAGARPQGIVAGFALRHKPRGQSRKRASPKPARPTRREDYSSSASSASSAAAAASAAALRAAASATAAS